MRQDIDGFDNYSDITTRWDAFQQTNGGIVFSSAFARFPALSGLVSKGIKLNQNCWCRKNLLSNASTLILGVAWQTSALVVSGSDPILYFEDNGSVQCSLAHTSSGAFQFNRGTATVLATSAPGLVGPAFWHFIEIVVTFSGTVGTVSVFLDASSTSAPILTATGLNNISTANAFANQYRLIEGNGVSFYLMDDVYVFDSTTGSNNARLGDQRLLFLPPSGAGASTQFTPTGAATNWQAASQNPPVPATIYNADSTPGHEDLFVTPAVVGPSAPNFVVVRRQHYKTDAAAHTDQSAVKSGATTATSTAVAVPSTATYQDDDYINDPNTGSPWASWAAINNAQVGYVETT